MLQIKEYWTLNVQQYMDELRAKRAANFEAIGMYKTVWNYDAHAKRAATSIELEMYKQMLILRAKRAAQNAVQNN